MYDAETGLHCTRFRYYSPALGRFLQFDPSGQAGGVNLYAYTANPLVLVDVLGLRPQPHGAGKNNSGVATGGERAGRDSQLPPDRLSNEELKAEIARFDKDSNPNSYTNALRYERYRRKHGAEAKSFDDWFLLSRGDRRGGPDHRAIQDRLVEQNEGAVREFAIGGRAVDVYVRVGPGGKPVYHQIGGLNPSRGDPIARERRAIRDLRQTLGDDADICYWDKTTPGADAPVLRNPDRQPGWIDPDAEI